MLVRYKILSNGSKHFLLFDSVFIHTRKLNILHYYIYLSMYILHTIITRIGQKSENVLLQRKTRYANDTIMM